MARSSHHFSPCCYRNQGSGMLCSKTQNETCKAKEALTDWGQMLAVTVGLILMDSHADTVHITGGERAIVQIALGSSQLLNATRLQHSKIISVPCHMFLAQHMHAAL